MPRLELKQHDGQVLRLKHKPLRIVSLVPSTTETLVSWGKAPVARTQFCIYPEEQVAAIPSVGGTKTPKLEEILKFAPDLIIANKEENRKEDIDFLSQKVDVWVNYPTDIVSTLTYLKDLSQLCENKNLAEKEIKQMQSFFSSLRARAKKSVVCFIWKKPWMVAAKNTYISCLIECLADNAFADMERYPVIELNALRERSFEHVILLTEPFAFKDVHRKELEAFCSENAIQAKVSVLCGEDFTWPGIRAMHAVKSMQGLLKENSQGLQ